MEAANCTNFMQMAIGARLMTFLEYKAKGYTVVYSDDDYVWIAKGDGLLKIKKGTFPHYIFLLIVVKDARKVAVQCYHNHAVV